ncbi:NmrA/HSCARG family protein [Novosphingobium terrae]|uniref:NmrA/HSCARG family protein n=1 Tax=Novosphingobium terrae TaxID=2726189 RepID=UPI00197DDCC6|nr:NmrA/HSCARG family protein [Novosphingobium terrae]
MTILVTGATGTIGSQVLAHLAAEKVSVRALTRSPGKAAFPAGVEPVTGDLSDPGSILAALQGVSTLFLLVANVADELTQAMLAVDAAREAGVKGIVYLSVYRGEAYADVPHFAGKATVERMIAALDLPATILQPAYFMQNDLRQQQPLTGPGFYVMPVGGKGISMVDTGDIALAAARELLRRERAEAPLPAVTYPLVGPDALTGEALAALWSDVLGRSIHYAGDATETVEQMLKASGPGWLARDLVLMLRRYQSDGAVASAEELAATAAVLGRAPRSYRAFAEQAAAWWTAA